VEEISGSRPDSPWDRLVISRLPPITIERRSYFTDEHRNNTRNTLRKVPSLIVAGCAVLASVVSAGPAWSDQQIAQECQNFAHPPFFPSPTEVAAEGIRKDGMCGNANVELFIFLDRPYAPDREFAHTAQFQSYGGIATKGPCEAPGQLTAGYYSELRVNGQSVAVSERIKPPGAADPNEPPPPCD
jgi:hypothetical protein